MFSSFLLFTKHPVVKQPVKEPVATCYGRSSCIACSNCSRCKHCSGGGTCGVCSSSGLKPQSFYSNEKTTKAEVYSGQCKALTKKGARCKRSGGSNGYCWQHGK
ncbi:DUF5763 domain-containing protein [Pedobacter nototheniae]|uniref:DUF5763 domain-containing protein n=1 Tax=Pedobacter nototheniae TaxID=2488994 RepID=UPI00397729AC